MKHLFTALTGAAVVVVAWGGYHLFSPSTSSANARLAGAPIPEVPRVDPTDQALLAHLERSVDGLGEQLAREPESVSTEPLLALGPERNPSEKTAQRTEREVVRAPAPPLPTRHLSLILEGSERRAVIDGRLVSAGAELEGDGRVAEIRSRSVLIQESHGRSQEIALDDLDGLGTLRAVSSRGNQSRETLQ